jgi:hypothetical protein
VIFKEGMPLRHGVSSFFVYLGRSPALDAIIQKELEV